MTHPRPPGEHGGRHALLVVALVLWAAWCAAGSWSPSGLSWHYFADAGHALTHGSGLAVYVDQPTLQVGPLAIVVAAGFDALGADAGLRVAQVVMAAVGPLLLLLLAPQASGRRSWLRLLVAGALVVPAWTVLAVRWGHLDDVLAMAGGVIALAAAGRRRPGVASAGIAAAVAAKPWAVGFAPILLAPGLGGWPTLAGAGVAGVAPWLPFVMAEPGTLEALRPPVPLIPGSGLHTLGVRGRFVPDWGRTMQLVGLTLAGLLAALRERWAGVLLVALAVRIALDPQDNPYYVGSAVLAAAAYDLVGRRGLLPWATVATYAALWQPFTADYARRLETSSGLAHWWYAHPTSVGWIHLGWAVGMLLLVFLGPRTGPDEAEDPPAPTEGAAGLGPRD